MNVMDLGGMMTTRTLCWLTFLVALNVACSDPAERAIEAVLRAEIEIPSCLAIDAKFPYRFEKPTPSFYEPEWTTEHRQQALDALAYVGLVTSTTDGQSIEYDVTDLGRSVLKDTESRTLSKFCYAEYHLIKVVEVRVPEPAEMSQWGRPRPSLKIVDFRYEVRNFSSWSKDPQLVNMFDKLERDLREAEAGKPLAGTLPIESTPEGWRLLDEARLESR